MNENLGNIQLRIIPEYSPKASSHAEKLSEKFPLLLKGEKEFPQTTHVDLGIVAIDLHDFQSKSGKSETTIWHVKHIPLMLLEFKSGDSESIKKGIKNDLRKCAAIKRSYFGVHKVYFCCLSDEKLGTKNYKDLQVQMMEETGINNLTICYGTWHLGDWGVT